MARSQNVFEELDYYNEFYYNEVLLFCMSLRHVIQDKVCAVCGPAVLLL
jgi:hypothetical protein